MVPKLKRNIWRNKEPKLKEDSDEEVPSHASFIKTPFKINKKYPNNVLVYKKLHGDSIDVYQGEVQRIKKKMGLFSSKIKVYVKINNDRINIYDMPLTDVPKRQFLFDWEKISAEIDKKEKSTIRIQVEVKGKDKEYVFKVEDETQAKDWWNFIQKATKKKEAAQEASNSKKKDYKQPHISEAVFLRDANTFDLVQFKNHGVKTIGVILQVIDKDLELNMLCENMPDILYYDQQSKIVTERSLDELLSSSKVFYFKLSGYDCQHDKLEAAYSLIKDVVSQLLS